jgi:hypothetical protein
VPIDPHLGRIGEVAADLDEAGAELAVVDIEGGDADPPLALLELEVGDARPGGAVAGAEHPLELLRRYDRDHPEPALPLGPLQVGPHTVELAITPATTVRLPQVQDRDLLGASSAGWSWRRRMWSGPDNTGW